MKIVVDFDLCESNAVCMQIAPDVFEVRDDDFLYVLNENPDESDRERMEECVQRCPKQAISIELIEPDGRTIDPHRRRRSPASAGRGASAPRVRRVASC